MRKINILQKNNFKNNLNEYKIELPNKYYDALIETVKCAYEIYGFNLVDIMLAGSGGKSKIINNWSDLDLYIITNEYNMDLNKMYYKALKIIEQKLKIHIGTTFYSKTMFLEGNIDNKTRIALYEHINFKYNSFLLKNINNLQLSNIKYEQILHNEINNIFNVFQTVQRYVYEYESNKDEKSFHILVKKLYLLVKMYLNIKYNIFTFGYEDAFKLISEKLNIKIKIISIMQNFDKNGI